MITRIGRKKFRVFGFDIETHNDNESIIENTSSMWLGAIFDETAKEDDESIYLRNMDEVIDKLIELSHEPRKHGKTRVPKNIVVYIYNLSFEWSFLLPRLLERGVVYESTINGEHEMAFNSITTKSCSSVWQVELRFSPKGGTVYLRDLSKIFAGGLSTVAKSFGLETQKGEIDYRMNRRRSPEEAKLIDEYVEKHPEVLDQGSQETHDRVCDELRIPKRSSYRYEPTKEEKSYLFKDVRIIVEVLQEMIRREDKVFFQVVSSASYACKNMIKQGYPRSSKPYADFRKEYPELDKEESEFLRHSVAGGITYAPRGWQFRTIEQKILHIDMHQAHPTSAYANYFPYGKGRYYQGEPKPDKICCCHIRVSYSGVRIHSIIQLINLDFISDKELWVWDVEIPTMRRCYLDLEIEFIDGYAYEYKPLPWRKFYSNNYNKRLKAKREGDLFLVQLYKLLNNASYGKLLEKPHNTIIKNIIDEFGIINSEVIDKKEEFEKINSKYTYLPVGSLIPAYTRIRLVETALMFGWENIAYFDTDSIFVVINKDTMDIWENKVNQKDFLGGWGLEEICDRAQFTAPKRYKTEVKGKASVKAGGINFTAYIKQKASEKGIDPSEYAVSFDEMDIVSSKWDVQRAYRCVGGTLIRFQHKEMKVAKKYLETYINNSLD